MTDTKAKVLKTLEGSVHFGREAADDIVLHHPSPWSEEEFREICESVELSFVDPFKREKVDQVLYAPFVGTALASFRRRIAELVPDISKPPPGFRQRDPFAQAKKRAAEIAQQCAEVELKQRRLPWPTKHQDKVEIRYLRKVLQEYANTSMEREKLEGIVEAAHEAFRARIKELSES